MQLLDAPAEPHAEQIAAMTNAPTESALVAGCYRLGPINVYVPSPSGYRTIKATDLAAMWRTMT